MQNSEVTWKEYGEYQKIWYCKICEVDCQESLMQYLNFWVHKNAMGRQKPQRLVLKLLFKLE